MNPRWKVILAFSLLLSAACGSISQALQSATPQHADYHAPAHIASSSTVTLASIPENIAIHPATSENYFDADIDYLATINYSATGNNDAYAIELTEHAQSLTYNGASLKWDIGVKPTVPLGLSVNSSSGDLALNLGKFTLAKLDAGTSSGHIDADLPAGQPYTAALETSSGDMNVTLADQSAVDFSKLNSSSGKITLTTGNGSTVTAASETSSGAVTLNVGSGATVIGGVTTSSGVLSFSFGADAAASLNIGTSSGSVTASVPKDAAVRLQIDGNSSGSVSVPDWLKRVSGQDKTGTWESDGFAQAERQIVIHVASDSSGAVTVTEAG